MEGQRVRGFKLSVGTGGTGSDGGGRGWVSVVEGEAIGRKAIFVLGRNYTAPQGGLTLKLEVGSRVGSGGRRRRSSGGWWWWWWW